MPTIDSQTVGDPSRFLPLDVLETRLAELPPAPRDLGTLTLIVRRREGGTRELLERVALTPEEGLPGDAWGRRPPLNPEAQLAVIQTDIAELIANGQPLPLFGDNLFLNLDLSRENLPTGSRLRVGAAVLEVTPKPHNGCAKFHARFGAAALRFASHPDRRHLNLRGIYLKVVEGGELAVGDAVMVLSR